MKAKDVIASSAGYLDEFMWMSGMLGKEMYLITTYALHGISKQYPLLSSLTQMSNNTPSCTAHNIMFINYSTDTVWRKILTGENFDEWASGKF